MVGCVCVWGGGVLNPLVTYPYSHKKLVVGEFAAAARSNFSLVEGWWNWGGGRWLHTLIATRNSS